MSENKSFYGFLIPTLTSFVEFVAIDDDDASLAETLFVVIIVDWNKHYTY